MREHPSEAEAQLVLRRGMYGLKPVPFTEARTLHRNPSSWTDSSNISNNLCRSATEQRDSLSEGTEVRVYGCRGMSPAAKMPSTELI